MRITNGWAASYEFACYSRECRPPGINGGTGGSSKGRSLKPLGAQRLPGDAGTAVDEITKLGGRAVVVGGWVRDQLLGLKSKDIDIEVHGASPDQVRAALEKVGRVDAVGVAFGVLKFGHDVDVSFPRRDSKTGAGHTGFEIQFDPNMTMKEALARRDFTINSMAFDPKTGEVIDPHGGRKDMQDGILRATDPAAFGDDPLRVMRGVQFAARFDMKFDRATANLANKLVDEFDTLSKERIWGEWEKILNKGQSLGAAARALKVTGWDKHFPEFNEVKANIADRLMKTAAISPARRAAISLGATFSRDLDGLKSFTARIDAPIQLRQAATRLAKDSAQLLGTDANMRHPADVEVRLLARALGRDVPMRDWLTVHPAAHLEAAARRQGVLDQAQAPLLNGDHLKALGWTPGPRFGVVLRDAQAQQDIQGWKTADQALDWVRRNQA